MRKVKEHQKARDKATGITQLNCGINYSSRPNININMDMNVLLRFVHKPHVISAFCFSFMPYSKFETGHLRMQVWKLTVKQKAWEKNAR